MPKRIRLISFLVSDMLCGTGPVSYSVIIKITNQGIIRPFMKFFRTFKNIFQTSLEQYPSNEKRIRLISFLVSEMWCGTVVRLVLSKVLNLLFEQYQVTYVPPNDRILPKVCRNTLV